ncbi:MAG: DUF4197 domain-containing protein [Syntrophaceae bacterium]
MKERIALVVLGLMMLAPGYAAAGFLDEIFKVLQAPGVSSSQDEGTVVSGLKEALSMGTAVAVKAVAKENGYYGNDAIQIPLPENIQLFATVLKKAGLGSEVDAFMLSMNRAAEKAAPKAKDIFVGAIKAMTIQDAGQILEGGDTAATEYFKAKTSAQLAQAFKPEIAASMNSVGVTQHYKTLTNQYFALAPFANRESLDLDQYVTGKALEGLFFMVGQEEKKIRQDPAARTTALLKQVFGNR